MSRPLSTRLKDIADRVGTSVPAVSAVVNGTRTTTGVSDELRRRIIEAAEEMGYVANATASSLASGKSQTIGLIVRNLRDPIVVEGLASAETVCSRHEHSLMVSTVDESPDWVRMLRRGQVDFLVALSLTTLHVGAIEVPQNLRHKVAVVGPVDSGGIGATDRQWGVQVAWQDAVGGRKAGRYLVNRGRRHVALLVGERPGSPRVRGALDALQNAGLDVRLVHCPDESDRTEAGLAMARRLFNDWPQVDGVFMRTDDFAGGFTLGMAEAGRATDSRLDVVGYGGLARCFPRIIAPVGQSMNEVLEMYFTREPDGMSDQLIEPQLATAVPGKWTGCEIAPSERASE